MTTALNGNGHRRRQVVAQVLAEETHCGICGQPVDKTLTMAWGQHGPRCKGDGCAGCVPHPMRPEVDEIVQRQHGGSPIERSNCRLTHRACNNQRNRKASVPADPTAYPISAAAWSGYPWGGTPTPTP